MLGAQVVLLGFVLIWMVIWMSRDTARSAKWQVCFSTVWPVFVLHLCVAKDPSSCGQRRTCSDGMDNGCTDIHWLVQRCSIWSLPHIWVVTVRWCPFVEFTVSHLKCRTMQVVSLWPAIGGILFHRIEFWAKCIFTEDSGCLCLWTCFQFKWHEFLHEIWAWYGNCKLNNHCFG